MPFGTMRKFIRAVPFFLVLHLAPLSLSIAQDTIAPGQSINDIKTLVSAEGSFELGFFSPGSSNKRYLGIWYGKITVQTIVWVANRQRPLSDSTGVLTIANNGSLILTNGTGTVFWSTPATNARSPVAQLLDNGNFVVLDADDNVTGTYAWQGFNYPSDTMLPGMKIGWDLRTGLNRSLTAWKEEDDPARGEYSLGMDIHGVPQVVIMAGLVRQWRSRPWVGGVPDREGNDIFNYNFVANSDEVSYRFDMVSHSILFMIRMNQSGTVQHLAWLNQSSSWTVLLYEPKDQCDTISQCGPYGLCNTNDSPICNCLQGFTAKSPQDLYLRVGTNGCVRKTPLDCRNGTDGFLTVNDAKLPDTLNATVNDSMSLDDCKRSCLNNCSCTGYASSDTRGGNGCIIWLSELTDIRVLTIGGQDMYVRLAAADLGSASEQSHKRWVIVITVVSVVLGMLLLGWIGYYAWSRLKTKRRGGIGTTTNMNEYHIDDGNAEDLELPLLDMGTIVVATDNFSSENKLGEGGFGPVYKGRLAEGQEIAVKRLSKTSRQGLDEFKNEVLSIAKLQHRNLVRLLGCCIGGEEMLLIYEYMPNKSLDAFLFDKTKSAELDWQTRYNIIVGIVRGLLYLHQDSRFRIIHRDLKASNILLDKNMNPKISDFGLARIFGGDETEANTRKVVGTYGYMSPEYAMDGIFSVKSDVFSFGVIVLEIISSKKNRGVYLPEPHQNLLAHAWSLWKEGNDIQLVDESMGYSYPMTKVMRCIKVGLLCVQECPEDRPTMSSVLLMLSSDNASLPQPKQPGFALTRHPVKTNSTSMKQDSNTINDVTITIFEGR